MLQQHHISNQPKLSWPNECQTILKLSPLLLAGMSGNRSTLHHLIRSNGDLNSETVDVASITAEKLLSMRKESRKYDIGHKSQQSERTIVHSKKLHEELLLPPIPHGKTPGQDQEPSIFNNSVIENNATAPVSMRLSNKSTSKKSRLKISDCMYTFHVQDPKEPIKNVNNDYRLKTDDDVFTDDRYFTRSYYNRKNEKDIYSKPPNMRRVLFDISPSDPEYGTDQSWITSWEPQNEFISKSLKNISLKTTNNSVTKRSSPLASKTASKRGDLAKLQNQKVGDSYCPYALPKRQEVKSLDGDFVARLVEIQTGHAAHRHRKMRPTLGVSKLQKKTRVLHIGPSTKNINHNDLNEDPDDLDLALQISNLSLEENAFIQDVLNQTQKLKLSYVRAKNKRKKKSSHLFRTLQSNVETIVNSETSNITETLRYKMDKFLMACKKDQIFLEVILSN
jgi:hypothetical protein